MSPLPWGTRHRGFRTYLNGDAAIHLSDEKHERLRQLAERRKISMNELIDEFSTVAWPSSTQRGASERGRPLDPARRA